MKKQIKKSEKLNWKPLLFLIVCVALFLRIKYFIGLNWSDDVMYVYLANKILKNEYKPSYMASLRLMMIFPLAFFFRIFGISDFSATLYPLLLSIGNVILAFFIGKLVANEKVGLIASLLMCFYPLDVNYATWIMPDVPICFFSGLSVFFFLKAEKEKKNYKTFLFLAGIFAWFAYSLKFSGLTVFIFFLSFYFIKTVLERKIPFRFVFIVLGFSLLFFLECTYYFITTGDFLLQFNSGFKYFAEKERLKYEFVTDFKYYPLLMFNLDHNFRFMWKNKYTYFGYFYYLVMFSLIFLLIYKVKSAFPIILWFLAVFLYMQFGTMSFREYIPMHRLDRHLTLISLPSILILSIFLEWNSKQKLKYTASVLILISLCISFLAYIDTIYKVQKDATKDIRLIFEELKKLPEKPVYSDSGAVGHLLFYSKFKNENLYRVLDYRSCEELKDSYIIVNATRGWIEYTPMLNKFPSCVFEKPNNWILIKTITSDATTYPYNLYDPEIYYVS